MRIPYTLPKINIKNGLLQLTKTPAPPLEPMLGKNTRPVTALIAVTNLRPMRDQTLSKKVIKGKYYSLSNKSKVREIKRDTNQEDEVL